MKLIFIYIFSGLIFLSGCASMNDSLTPSVTTKKDAFDGTLIINQSPVSSASKMSEPWHTMGFTWKEQNPDTVYVTAGVHGINNITKLAFNVDGEIINNIRTASSLTNYGDWSTRKFAVPIQTFVKIAKGKDVKMRISQIDTYSVSSFGSSNTGAIVNSKFPPFLAELKKAGSIE